jgi:hypothetical protein
MDLHMASAAVAELLHTFSSDASLFASAPAIYGLPEKLPAIVTFTRASISRIADSFLLFSSFLYKPGFVPHAIVGWKGLVAR